MQASSLKLAPLVTTPENRSALLAVQEVVEGLAHHQVQARFNPFYLHGPPGSGKSHLVSVLIEQATLQRPDLLVHLSSARDLADLERPASTDTAEELDDFPAQLTLARRSDLIILEDLQHLPPWLAPRLVGLVDRLRNRGQQLVLTATTGPAQLRPREQRLSTHLTSRLAAGTVVGVTLPGPESRLALLREQAQRLCLRVSEEVLSFLATHLSGIRQLLGAIQQLQTLSEVYNTALDVQLVAEQLGLPLDSARRVTVEQIVERVSEYFQVERRDLQSSQRFRHVLVPRQVGMYLTRRLTGLSLEEIGAYFGGRDHSTVLHACRKIEQALTTDAALSGAVRCLSAELR